MTHSRFTLSAFGDEIDDDVDAQLDVLNELDIRFLELRQAWGVNVLDLDDDQVGRVAGSCDAHSVRISCIGSPVGKSPITKPLEDTLADLARILDVAESLGTNRVRVFSFYPPEGGQQARYVEDAAARLGAMAKAAGERGAVLLLENENGLVGDVPERCRALVEGVNSPSLRFVWDTGNFPHAGVERAVDRGWPLLREYVAYVQVKDTRLSDRTITVAGEGDGQVIRLLERLRDAGYQGFLALEPHLKRAGQRGGFSGPGGMRRAAEALRGLMAQAGCIEA